MLYPRRCAMLAGFKKAMEPASTPARPAPPMAAGATPVKDWPEATALIKMDTAKVKIDDFIWDIL